MEKGFARIITIIFHPLVFPLVGLLVLYNSGTYVSLMSVEAKRVLFYMIGTGSFVFPSALLLLMAQRKMISDFSISVREERFLPLTLIFLLFLFTFFLIYRYPVNRLIHGYLLALSIGVLLTILVNVFMKVSVHLVAIGGLAGLVLSLSLKFGVPVAFIFILSILAAGLTAYALLKLEKHNEKEVYGGFLLGFATLLTVMIFYV